MEIQEKRLLKKISLSMMKYLFFIAALYTTSCLSQTEVDDKKAILAVMKAQEEAWSRHDLEGFMQGYWKNDSLKFFGSRGVTYGWEKTLENYKMGYPTPKHTGTLQFLIKDISKIEDHSYWVMGNYYLLRKAGDEDGTFIIIFKKIDGEWKIVADKSC